MSAERNGTDAFEIDGKILFETDFFGVAGGFMVPSIAAPVETGPLVSTSNGNRVAVRSATFVPSGGCGGWPLVTTPAGAPPVSDTLSPTEGVLLGTDVVGIHEASLSSVASPSATATEFVSRISGVLSAWNKLCPHHIHLQSEKSPTGGLTGHWAEH